MVKRHTVVATGDRETRLPPSSAAEPLALTIDGKSFVREAIPLLPYLSIVRRPLAAVGTICRLVRVARREAGRFPSGAHAAAG